MLSTGLYIYVDVNAIREDFIQEVMMTRTKCLGNKKILKSPKEGSFTGVKSILHNASPQNKTSGWAAPASLKVSLLL